MFERVIAQTIQKITTETLQERSVIALADILQDARIPARLKPFFETEVHWWLYNEALARAANKRFDYDHPELASLLNYIEQVQFRHARFEREEFAAVLDSAVKLTYNYLCRPQTTLKWYIFRGQPVKPLNEVLLRFGAFVDYPYFRTVFTDWVDRKRAERSTFDAISATEFERVTRRIDDQILLNCTVEGLLEMMDPLFEFVGEGTEQLLPLDALIIFFDDKNIKRLVDQLENYRDRGGEVVGREGFVALLDELLSTANDEPEADFSNVYQNDALDDVVREHLQARDPADAYQYEPATPPPFDYPHDSPAYTAPVYAEREASAPAPQPVPVQTVDAPPADAPMAGEPMDMAPRAGIEPPSRPERYETIAPETSPAFSYAPDVHAGSPYNTVYPPMGTHQDAPVIVTHEAPTHEVLPYESPVSEDPGATPAYPSAESVYGTMAETEFAALEVSNENGAGEPAAHDVMGDDVVPSAVAGMEDVSAGVGSEVKDEDDAPRVWRDDDDEEEDVNLIFPIEGLTPNPRAGGGEDDPDLLLDDDEEEDDDDADLDLLLEEDDEPVEPFPAWQGAAASAAQPTFDQTARVTMTSAGTVRIEASAAEAMHVQAPAVEMPVAEAPAAEASGTPAAEASPSTTLYGEVNRDPALEDVRRYLDESLERKVLKKIFRKDQMALDSALDRLNESANWRDASQVLNEIFVHYQIDPYSRTAIRFTDSVYGRFLKT